MKTYKTINRAIAAATNGMVELVNNGDGYHYFIYDDMGPGFETENVMVPYLRDLSGETWVEYAIDFYNRQIEKGE